MRGSHPGWVLGWRVVPRMQRADRRADLLSADNPERLFRMPEFLRGSRSCKILPLKRVCHKTPAPPVGRKRPYEFQDASRCVVIRAAAPVGLRGPQKRHR